MAQITMAEEKLHIENDEITLTDNHGQATVKQFKDIELFYYLIVGSDVLANDSICYLIQFDDQLWLIPEMTSGAIQLEQWVARLDEDRKSRVVQIDYLPWRWRAKFLFIPGIKAKLQILPVNELMKNQENFEVLEDKLLSDLF